MPQIRKARGFLLKVDTAQNLNRNCGKRTRPMNQSFVYHAKNPVCALAKNDQRVIRPRIMESIILGRMTLMDGRAMTKQQVRLEELAEQGRQMAKHPELKPKPRPEGRGMAFAMAHLDELLEKGKLQKQAREVASPQESNEVFHDADDPIDNGESIWMDANETSPSWEMPTDIAESADVMESELAGEEAIDSTEIGAMPSQKASLQENRPSRQRLLKALMSWRASLEKNRQLSLRRLVRCLISHRANSEELNKPSWLFIFSKFIMCEIRHCQSLCELGGVQQNQNPFTEVEAEVEAEREDFSMWSFLRAAGLVCGCWGR